jgi:hypothetical protein
LRADSASKKAPHKLNAFIQLGEALLQVFDVFGHLGVYMLIDFSSGVIAGPGRTGEGLLALQGRVRDPPLRPAGIVAGWGAALRTGAAGSKDESPCWAIHKQRPYQDGKCNGSRPKAAATNSRATAKSRRDAGATSSTARGVMVRGDSRKTFLAGRR